MTDPSPEIPAPSPVSPIRLLVNWLLALGGVAFFVYLVVSSGITLATISHFGWGGFALLVFISGVVHLSDTVAWFYAVRHLARPPVIPLFGLRIGGDAMTNALPGGVVLGETYKAAMLKRSSGISIADNAATLLTIKFGLAFTQALFLLSGLALSFGLIRDRAPAVLGFAGAEYVGLALTLGFSLLLLIPFLLMLRGTAFSSITRGLARLPIPPLRRTIARNAERIEGLDRSCRRVLSGNRKHLLLVFFFLQISWLISALESYVLIAWLGISTSLRAAYVLESVGSMFRLIFFFIPSGIGGQDVSFFALFQLYGFPRAAGGAFVLIKRCKELFWIGVGFLLILCFRRSQPPEKRMEQC